MTEGGPGPGRGRRAPAMPPDERRAAIVAATLPLLVERGPAVSTRQIAEAAGIAEGTIFRVFPDKDAVVRAVVEHAFDPEPTERALAAIDGTLPFDDQLVEAVTIIQNRVAQIWRLMSAVGEMTGPGERPSPPPRPPESPALAALFAAHRDRIVADPEVAARQLRAITLALSHPVITADAPRPPAEIVALLLDGIRARPGAQPAHDRPMTTGAAPC